MRRLRFVLALPFCTLAVAAGLLSFLSITIAALFARAARRILG